jgi:hypothetical protein
MYCFFYLKVPAEGGSNKKGASIPIRAGKKSNGSSKSN